MDIFTKEKRSEVMAKIRGKNTKIEVAVFRYLRREGVYFQKHYRRAPGSPDIALPRKKVAVFIDGDFWHGRDYARRKAKLPPFWQAKIARNRRRDREVRRKLVALGWTVLRVWEGDLNKRGSRKWELIKRRLTA